jgi:hypothetical protein
LSIRKATLWQRHKTVGAPLIRAFCEWVGFSKSFFTTGSNPPCAKGWHRSNRQPAIPNPRKTPYRSTASIAYSEHVGTYRQEGENIGEIHRL